MTDTRYCTWSDLPADECHHCDPSIRIGDPLKAARRRRAALAQASPALRPPADLDQYVARAVERGSHHGAPTSKTTTFCGARSCSRATSGTTLCPECAAELALYLGEVPWIVEQLRFSYSRQVRFSQKGPTGKATDQPLVINLASADTASDYAATLATWQGRLADHAGQPVRHPNPVTAAVWIAQHERTLHTFTDAGKMLRDLASIHRHALAVINRPPEKWFTGTCSDECPVPLYADEDAASIECPRCGTVHDVEQRRRTLLEQADDTLVTATEAARAIVVLSDYNRGENRLVKRIGMWSERKRIEERGAVAVHGRSRPLYRLGDIRQLLTAEQVAAS